MNPTEILGRMGDRVAWHDRMISIRRAEGSPSTAAVHLFIRDELLALIREANGPTPKPKGPGGVVDWDSY